LLANGLAGSITMPAFPLPFGPVIDKASGQIRRLWRPVKV